MNWAYTLKCSLWEQGSNIR